MRDLFNSKKPGIMIILVFMILCHACTSTTSPNPVAEQAHTAAFETALAVLIQSQITPSPTPSPIPSATPTSTPLPVYSESRDQILSRMQSYGVIEDTQLSDLYWQKLTARIEAYGVAQNILTLEYHGDDYDMYDGGYTMTPETFKNQIDLMMANDYHFVTMHEAEGFVYGWLELPARSVILTTDISDLHVESLTSISAVFSELAEKYGYNPHMLAFIWTGAMNAGECADNTCWDTINTVNASGYFSFGSHSTTHGDFGQISLEEGILDLERSKQAILENTGIQVYTLAWPFETCSPYPESLEQIGITLAWGGSTKPLSQNFAAWQDPRPLCLPRLLPPNIQDVSMRPAGMSLQNMLDSALSAP